VRRRGVLQNSALAFVGDATTKAATFVLLAVAARALGTREFATLAAALATASVLTAVFDCGAQTLLTRDGAVHPGVRGAMLLALTRARLPLLGVAIAASCLLGALDGDIALAVATTLLAAASAGQLTLSGVLRAAEDLRPEAVARIVGAFATLAGGIVSVLLFPKATPTVFILGGVGFLVLAPMGMPSRHVISAGERRPAWPTLMRALPLGLMAIATLAYYRSGTIALQALSTPRQTAAFAAASTLGFGLLSAANAVTTGLLPRLSACGDPDERAAVARRALVWTGALAAVAGGSVAVLARPLMALAFGSRYAGAAAAPLAILAVASVLIAISGILGTVLIATGQTRPVAIQVGVSLVVNLVALAVLAPRLGAVGAALATLVCEVSAVLTLAGPARACIRRSRPVGIGRTDPASTPTAPGGPGRRPAAVG
jgi:O-antigen/teichoic acid export membrane protein